MPGYSCSVKERMLYSSCKAAVIGYCEHVEEMEIVKKVGASFVFFFVQCHLMFHYYKIQELSSNSE